MFPSKSWSALPNDFTEQIQVAVVLFLCSIFFLGHTIGTVISIYILKSPLYHIVVVYVIWVFIIDCKTPKRKGRRFESFRYFKAWNFFRDYFPIKLVRTKRLSSERNYVFGYHPHGIMPCGAWLNFCTEATCFSELFPGITPHLLTLNCKYWGILLMDMINIIITMI